MKANEIQIGDWVEPHQCMIPTVYCKVEGIYSDGTVHLDKAERLFALDELTPVPITPEILEKNGFKKYNGLYRLDIAEGVFVNADFKSKEPFVSVHNTCYRATPICWYLHQLQHALRLCGIEKEIIL